MKRLIAAVLIMGLLPTATAVAYDQGCMTGDIEWTELNQPMLVNVHFAAVGVRIALVGNQLWTQYNTTDNYLDDEDNQILSTHLADGVASVEACPNGLVTLTSPAPPPTDDAELGDAVVVIDVIAYWEQYLSRNFGP